LTEVNMSDDGVYNEDIDLCRGSKAGLDSFGGDKYCWGVGWKLPPEVIVQVSDVAYVE
jgi:hypothetical protein